MAAPFTGGCACGAVRYECSAEPLMMGNCHCRDFLRATGVSGRIADVVQGLLVLALLLPPAILYVRERRRALSVTSSRV